MYNGPKVILTDREKEIFSKLMKNDEIKFVYTSYNFTQILLIRVNEDNQSMQIRKMDIILNGIGISFDDVQNLFTKFKGDNKSNSFSCTTGGRIKPFSIDAYVDSSITNDLEEDEEIDKSTLLERFEIMMNPKPINPTEIIKSNKIKFYIREDDDSLTNGENYTVQIAHEENNVTKFWSACSTHKNEVDHKDYETKLRQLGKIFNDDMKFKVVDYMFGAQKMHISKNSSSYQELKNKIDKNEFVSIDNKEFIDVTDEVTKIITDESKACTSQIKFDRCVEEFVQKISIG